MRARCGQGTIGLPDRRSWCQRAVFSGGGRVHTTSTLTASVSSETRSKAGEAAAASSPTRTLGAIGAADAASLELVREGCTAPFACACRRGGRV